MLPNKEIEQLKNDGWLDENFEVSKEIQKCIEKCKSPKQEDIFNAFKLFKSEETQILILGQDPYPENQKAHGFAFSVQKEYGKIDDSLLNIFKAVKAYKSNKKFNDVDINEINNWNTDLSEWAKKNKILLLNSALTYDDETSPETRIEIWQPFIKNIIEKLLSNNKNKTDVFLWGEKAQKCFLKAINGICITRNLIVFVSNHPSNRSVNNNGDFSEKAPEHFRLCDEFLNQDIWKSM